MGEITLEFDNSRANKKEFHNFKQPIDLISVNVNIVVSDEFKQCDERFKYFIGYQEDEIVKPLCIILPQMSGYIKYFKNGGKNMSFFVRNDNVLDKYNEIWCVIKKQLKIKFDSEPIYDGKYLKTKVREFDGVIKTNFLGNGVPKENMHYTCIACITIDSVIKIEKKNYPQVYLEECKYKIRKIQMSRFINTELDSDSDSESDAELMIKLESDSDSE